MPQPETPGPSREIVPRNERPMPRPEPLPREKPDSTRRVGEPAGPSPTPEIVPKNERPMPRPAPPPREKPAQPIPRGERSLWSAVKHDLNKVMGPLGEKYDDVLSPFRKWARIVACLLIALLVAFILRQVVHGLAEFKAFLGNERPGIENNVNERPGVKNNVQNEPPGVENNVPK